MIDFYATLIYHKRKRIIKRGLMKIFDKKVFIIGGNTVVENVNELKLPADVIDSAYKNTLAYPILMAHNVGDEKKLKLKFDALCSHAGGPTRQMI